MAHNSFLQKKQQQQQKTKLYQSIQINLAYYNYIYLLI